MNFVREHKTASLIVLVLSVIFLTTTVVFGRYIRNVINNFILETKAFYFNSSILSINGKNYSITNWDGVNSYPLTIDLNNRKNDERYTKSVKMEILFIQKMRQIVMLLLLHQHKTFMKGILLLLQHLLLLLLLMQRL